MKKPYAESTLKRLYEKLNTQLATLGVDINAIEDYVQACINFYQIIEAEEAWKMLPHALPKTSALRKLPKDLFDAFLSIAARDADKSYRVLTDKEFYNDGDESLYIVDELLTVAPNPKFGDAEREQLKACIESGKEYLGPSIEAISYDGFYELQEQREGKPLYIPKNILVYLDEDYYEKTPQIAAMERFLRKEARVPNEAIKSAMICMLVDICDIRVPVKDLPQAEIENIERCGGSIHGIQQVQRLANLLMDLSNNTRMPSNRGFTPNELHTKTGGELPKSISFGSGIQNSIRSGEMNPEEMRKAIVAMDLPAELKISILKEIDKATRMS